MAATLDGKGTVIALLNTVNPFSALTAGEGRGARLKQIEDVIALTTDDLGSTTAFYRMCRIPATAKVKKVEVLSDSVLDSNATSTLVLTFGTLWSDSTIDGTPAAYRGLRPAAAADGTNGAASTSNAVYGTIDKSTTDNAAIPLTEITFKGSVFTDLLAKVQKPLAKLFNFVTGQGQDSAPGYMDFSVHVTTAATTAVAGNLVMRVQYAE